MESVLRMKKVVILGALGMAGHIMAEVFSKNNYKVYGIAKQNGKYIDEVLDVTNFEELNKYLNRVKPDYVINCIGILVSKSNSDLSKAILINSYLPHFLSKSGNKNGFKLVHISTDCVFSGKQGGYIENSFRDGDDNYARTKALGELINNKDLTIRTSIIGPELKTKGATGLLDWFLKQDRDINGYTNAYWSGVTTLELANATLEFITQNINGLYHLCPDKKISKYELLKLFANIWNKQIHIEPYDNYHVDKSLICTRDDFHYKVPDYKEMLLELKKWMNEYPNIYQHYNK
jgi:dTDP-4-dehydrorhamnose reductase